MFDIRGDINEVNFLMESLGVLDEGCQAQKLNETESQFVRIGPRRCLLMAKMSSESDWDSELNELTTGRTLNATAVSDMYRGIQISGDDCEHVLSQMTTINFLEILVGDVCATEIFDTAGYLFRQAANTYIIYIESSFLHYALTRIAICVGSEDLSNLE